MDSREEAILKTLLYSDLFDYPLTEAEIHRFLINYKITKDQLHQAVKSKHLLIENTDNFFFIKGRGKIVSQRLSKEKFSLDKLEIAKKIIRKLSIIPTIKLIGISGTLAMQNCREDDDIDIFIIAQKNFAWTTRLLSALYLILLGVYRNKNSTKNKNKICLNLVLDENKMQFVNQDLFTAHEIIQLVPIFDRDKTYQQFMKANSWINKIFPNYKVNHKPLIKKDLSQFDQLLIFSSKLLFLEKIFKFLQLQYMKKSVTKEKLEDNFIGLHPFDYRADILSKYKAKIGEFSLK